MDYLERLEKAIEFIENNINEDIKVDEVAGVAGYSYYHFHRIFEAVLGETAGNYIRSRRLARAANRIQVSIKCIFEQRVAGTFVIFSNAPTDRLTTPVYEEMYF